MIICHVYFFSFSYVLFPAVVTQIFNLIAEFEIPVGIPTKKAIKKKSEIEMRPVIAEITISE